MIHPNDMEIIRLKEQLDQNKEELKRCYDLIHYHSEISRERGEELMRVKRTLEEARQFSRLCWWALPPIMRWKENVPEWIADGRLECGCEVGGHTCLIAEGGCGNCAEHCICERRV